VLGVQELKQARPRVCLDPYSSQLCPVLTVYLQQYSLWQDCIHMCICRLLLSLLDNAYGPVLPS
jgi:hypothetical protein